MASLVTKESVSRAARDLLLEGSDPTYANVRERLGGGSDRDINKYLPELLEEFKEIERLKATASAARDRALALAEETMQRVFLWAAKEADERVQSAEKVCAERLVLVSDDLKALQSMNRRLRRENADFSERVAALESKLEDAQIARYRAEAVAQERADELAKARAECDRHRARGARDP